MGILRRFSAQIEIMSALGPILRAPDGIGYVSTDPTKGDLRSYKLAFHSDLGFSPSPYRAIPCTPSM